MNFVTLKMYFEKQEYVVMFYRNYNENVVTFSNTNYATNDIDI